MRHTILLIYPALLLVLTFFGAKIAPAGETSPEFLSLEQTKMIRASACIGVIIHHLSQHTTGYGFYRKAPITIFNNAGILFTALFFFFSGYGLITNIISRPDYLNTFLQKRLPAVLIPFWVINLTGVILNRYVFGVRYGFAGMAGDILGVTLVNSNGWFIIEIAILYLVFYVLFSLIRNKDAALILLCLVTVLLIAYGFSRGHDVSGSKTHWFRGEWWYNSTIVFLFGMLYARFRPVFDSFCKKYYPVLVTAVCVLSALSFQVSVHTVIRHGYYQTKNDALATLAAQTAACLTFTALVILLNRKIILGNRLLRYLGGISTQLFLIHGYFAKNIFGGGKLNDFAYFAAVIVCSIASAAIISPFIKWAVKRVTTFLTPFRIVNYTLEHEIAEKRKKKRSRLLRMAAAAGMILCCIAAFLFILQKYYFARKEYRRECEAIRQAEIGDTVLWGRFETDPIRFGKERLRWIVIGRNGDQVCLLSEKGIAGSSFHHKHEAVSWEDSDLRTLLNSAAYTGMFSKYEAESIVPAGGDTITLLTVREADEVFASDRERELIVTPEAELKGTNTNAMSKDNLWDMKGYRTSWWWLRNENGVKDVTAPIVSVDGEIMTEEKEVNRPGGAVRPVIWVDCSL